MSGWLFHHLLFLAIIASAAFAWWKGGWPERAGAMLNLGVALFIFFLQRFAGKPILEPSLLALDALVGVGFLVLAVRFTSLWLGVAMLLQGGQFSLHAFYYVTSRAIDLPFVLVNNGISWGVVACIVGGTCVSWFQARRAASAGAPI